MLSVKEEVAKNLLFYRKRSNLTQKELADKVGVKHNSISSWEKATNSIDVEVLFKICSVFQISINEIYGIYANTKEGGFTQREAVLISDYNSLNVNGKEYIDKQIAFALSQDCYIANNEEARQAEYILKREEHIKKEALPFAAASGDTSNLEEVQRLYDKSKGGNNE